VVLVDLSERRIKHVLKRAEELYASRLVILGDVEMKSGAAKVLHTGDARREELVPRSVLVPDSPARS